MKNTGKLFYTEPSELEESGFFEYPGADDPAAFSGDAGVFLPFRLAGGGDGDGTEQRSDRQRGSC